ncbi:MAG: tryptophan synthase subunit alpha [Myxococcaceae bacterium]
MSRYEPMFARLSDQKRGAFVPFWMLGDPDLTQSLEIIEILVSNGADALELGIPFSDPVADGPVVQKAAMRALNAGANLEACFKLLTQIRQKYPEIPLGLLTYANLAICKTADWFYEQCAKAGVDAVLLADVPSLEAESFCEVALKHKIDPVLIAAPNMSEEQIKAVARLSKSYVYMVTRAGVTGANEKLELSSKDLIQKLQKAGGPPVLLGFGISKPEHVRQAMLEGAAGAISGSAVISLAYETPEQLPGFMKEMKAAC